MNPSHPNDLPAIGRVLVTGGAGYIGSHMVKLLGERTATAVTVLDNLSTGVAEAVLSGELVPGDLADEGGLDKLFSNRRFDAVIHFAASIVVPESVGVPLAYYANNTANTIRLLQAAVRHQVKYFVFSSTAAVYGMPTVTPLTEAVPTAPINPYGWSKLMNEQILRDTSLAYPGLHHVILRYFNVAGASLDGRIGQNSPKATHLIKVASETAVGKRSGMEIFGTDYDTPDGTGIRDYIHVEDLAWAHLDALKYLAAGGESEIFNCGYGGGYSVREVIGTMKQVSGCDFPVRESPRRPGDGASLVADNRRIVSTLGWRPRYDDLQVICRTALDWEKKLQERSR
jgi:UDP-glucose 4-epimerase